MQAVYPSRIDWKDEPSTNTPLGANNLNKMDYALYELDKRVLTLGGYEERAALSATNAETSEINAKTSENNSKVSETNAKTSEINAKDYMERAYAATPEGYDELVETVRLMDIATTTESILEKSKPGGLKINHIKGATEQNGTPTPSSPIGIKNVGDCVEMMQGFWNNSTGVHTSNEYYVCSKNKLPCTSGDIIKLIYESVMRVVNIVFFTSSGNVLSVSGQSEIKEAESVVPSGATHFAFNVSLSTSMAITPQTVGKISLTVNGKYVTQIKSHGKNELNSVYEDLQAGGVTFRCNANKSLDISGTVTGANNYMFEMGKYLKKGSYIVSGMGGVSANQNGDMLLRVYDATNGKSLADLKYGINEALFTIDKDLDNVNIYINFNTVGVTYSGTIYPMIRKADITDDTYEPYQETTAYIYTDEPIRDSDVVFNDKVGRNKGQYQLRGTETFVYNETYGFFETSGSSLNTNAWETNVLCTHLLPFSSAGSIDKYNWVQFNASKNIRLKVEGITTIDSLKAWLSSNNVLIEYPLATPTYETLDTVSQIALNSLETFDTVTYIEVDSRVQPSEIKVEYGTSKVGAITLKNELRTDTQDIRLNELQVALVALGSEV